MKSLTVENTTLADLEFVFELFESSIQYQEKKGYQVWRNYDRNALINDIQNKNQYKILMDGEIAIIFSVCYSDKIIWREREQADAIYLHRIVVNPTFKGQRLFGEILAWTKNRASQLNLKSVRMDTWDHNPEIVEYYKSFGFEVVEKFVTPNSEELPEHNRNLPITLLEIKP
ncbi:MAG TPA: N-acetyltransferase [Cytophagales bacterium]|jgi:hypothetical protein|nr:N-acetyltransferase [Cytophagales bacterium]